MLRGSFITFEGCEGVGKTTQIELLKQYLNDTHQDSTFLREPGGNKISEKIREIILSTESVGMVPECEAMLYCAARAQLIGQVIEPTLNEGKIVVCDRFIDSTFAYQGVARDLGEDYVSSLNDLTCRRLKPDVTIFLDMDPAHGFARKGGADKDDRMELEKGDFHQKVYKGYKLACEKYSDRIIAIDASGSVEEVHNAILKALRDRKVIK